MPLDGRKCLTWFENYIYEIKKLFVSTDDGCSRHLYLNLYQSTQHNILKKLPSNKFAVCT
jgi:hypothetical protein